MSLFHPQSSLSTSKSQLALKRCRGVVVERVAAVRVLGTESKMIDEKREEETIDRPTRFTIEKNIVERDVRRSSETRSIGGENELKGRKMEERSDESLTNLNVCTGRQRQIRLIPGRDTLPFTLLPKNLLVGEKRQRADLCPVHVIPKGENR